MQSGEKLQCLRLTVVSETNNEKDTICLYKIETGIYFRYGSIVSKYVFFKSFFNRHSTVTCFSRLMTGPFLSAKKINNNLTHCTGYL